MGAETLKSIDELVDQVVQLKTKYPTEFERTQQKVKDEFNERYERESARWGDRHALFKMGVDDALDGVYIEWMLITARFLSFLKDSGIEETEELNTGLRNQYQTNLERLTKKLTPVIYPTRIERE